MAGSWRRRKVGAWVGAAFIHQPVTGPWCLGVLRAHVGTLGSAGLIDPKQDVTFPRPG